MECWSEIWLSDNLFLMLCLNIYIFLFTLIDLHVTCPLYIVAAFLAVRVLFCGVWLRSDVLRLRLQHLCVCVSWGTTGARNLMSQSFRVEKFKSECLTSRKAIFPHKHCTQSLQWDLWARVKCGIILNCSQWIRLGLALASSPCILCNEYEESACYIYSSYTKKNKIDAQTFSLAIPPPLSSLSVLNTVFSVRCCPIVVYLFNSLFEICFLEWTTLL